MINPAHHLCSQEIMKKQRPLAEAIVELQYRRQPQVWKPYGDPGWEKSVRDAGYHLTYLAEAINASDPALWSEYLAWVKVLFANLNFPETVLPTTLDCTRQALLEQLSAESSALAVEMLDTGVRSLEHALPIHPSYLEGDDPLTIMARQYLTFLLQGSRSAASRLILDAVANGASIKDIYLHVFQPSQYELGRLWQTNQINVAQEHYCTAATQMIMSQLYPYIFQTKRKKRCVVVTCVGGELHEIGARMVADFFEMDGWDSHFIGANTPLESLLNYLVECRADILALSATMVFHVSKVAEIIAAVYNHSSLSNLRVIVGGYPFNTSPGLWQQVGADGYASNAQTALLEAERMLQR